MKRLHATGAALDRLVKLSPSACVAHDGLDERVRSELRVCASEYTALRMSERLDLAAVEAVKAGAM